MRLRLLEDELGALHAGISAHDGRMAQVKGWCVTVASGLLALAMTQDRPTLALSAVAAVLAFWLAESHIASIQRVMIRRLQFLERHFQGKPATEALSDRQLALPGMASGFIDSPEATGWLREVRTEWNLTLDEARSPYRILFYALVVAGVTLIFAAAFIFSGGATSGSSDDPATPTSSSSPTPAG